MGKSEETPYAFTGRSLEEWLQKIEQDLKGKKPLQVLYQQSPDKLTIAPAYHRENSQVRLQPWKEQPKWDIAAEVVVDDAHQANKKALQALEKGATSLFFYLRGTEDLSVLLKDIQLEYICLNLVVAQQAHAVAEKLRQHLKALHINGQELEGSLNFDPLENMARTGQAFNTLEKDLHELQELPGKLPAGFRPHAINLPHFAHAGATLGQQLGLALAMAYEYIHRLGLPSGEGFWVHFATGGDYFGEIAKYRALRRLWHQLLDELAFPQAEVRISAETGWRNKSILDPYNNMIRSTTEAMAAIIGGASEICVKPFALFEGTHDAFGERIALNQQHILEHESRLHYVRDMAQGSYFLEEHTEDLARVGWQFFRAIEKQGGYVEALYSGWLQKEITNAAQEEQEKFDQREKMLIGVNKYQKEDEALPDLKVEQIKSPPAPTDTPYPALPVRRLAEDVEAERLSSAP